VEKRLPSIWDKEKREVNTHPPPTTTGKQKKKPKKKQPPTQQTTNAHPGKQETLTPKKTKATKDPYSITKKANPFPYCMNNNFL